MFFSCCVTVDSPWGQRQDGGLRKIQQRALQLTAFYKESNWLSAPDVYFFFIISLLCSSMIQRLRGSGSLTHSSGGLSWLRCSHFCRGPVDRLHLPEFLPSSLHLWGGIILNGIIWTLAEKNQASDCFPQNYSAAVKRTSFALCIDSRHAYFNKVFFVELTVAETTCLRGQEQQAGNTQVVQQVIIVLLVPF